jgi:hypothetical protein
MPCKLRTHRPVQDWLNTPGPKYSRIRPVPPYDGMSACSRRQEIKLYLDSELSGEVQNEILWHRPTI